ncbi:zinc finger protein aebp2 [Holotrichia oblita]|uniref:Zinc finger protein aebp2 n=1 Tax=Holotrichia oblita TaxID=644536 RepID=A0ACB9T7G1_HOLOL|nr:zinc finger protein aebp2 [Holotrichia oblita]
MLTSIYYVFFHCSGVAVLSCTDCSGSSTSSDITDPGSPFSIASSHSEDSASQSAKMPPTQSAHHPPWSWTEENNPPLKRPTTTQDKAVFTKRLKTDGEETKQSPTCLIIDNINNKSTQITATSTPNNNLHLNNNNNNNNRKSVIIAQTPIVNAVNDRSNRNQPSPNHNNNNNNILNGKLSGKNSSNKTIITSSTQAKKQEIVIAPRIMQQGKITEYFKSQIKSNGMKKELSNIALKTNPLQKFASIVDKHKKVVRKIELVRTITSTNVKKVASSPVKNRKQSPISVPRKILPAPSKIPEKITVNNVGINNFHPVTLTAVTFPPNLTYIHTKTPKPPDNTNIFVPHFTTITGDKINTIPIVNRTPCLNVIQPIQKFTTINNFNSCVKLNATVVPIVKLNALPSRLNGSNFNVLSVETASPTVLSAKPPVTLTTPTATSIAPKQQVNNITNTSPPAANNATSNSININTNGNSSSSSTNTDSILGICRNDEPATPDSDSGISSTKDILEVSVSETVTDEPQKSPILSQPKTIRFPAKQQESSETKEKGSHSSDSTACQWSKCHLLFDTSGALLEHLQVEHVISQATQEQYVCLWLGCKVHGRTSCSRSWLERHVLAHAGTKPFRCIVDGCGMRFNSQLSLERHVNNHFNSDSSQNGNNKKAVENGSAKLFKRNGKKIRFRRQPWSARMFDFIDSGIMEGLQYRLLTMTEKRTSGEFENVAGDAVTVHSQILARRIEPDGSKKLLLRWHPKDIVPDEWISEKEYTAKKNVSIPKLMASSKDALNPVLFPNDGMRTRQKHRRKPSKTT